MIAYIGLFFSALVAATILPMQSEAVLVALLTTSAYSVPTLIIVATIGNVLGSVLNWYLGGYLRRFESHRWFPSSQSQTKRAQIWYTRYGRWTLLGSWLPIIGDPITVVAGIMKEPLLPFLLLVTIAKSTRYIILAAGTLALL